jgi:hypothetical protein
MWWKEKGESRGLLPQGVYEAKLTDAKLDTTKVPSKISLKFNVVDPGGDYDEDVTFVNLTFSDKAAKFVRWQLGVLGCYDVMESQDSEAAAISAAADAVFKIVDKTTCEIKVGHREYNGKTYLDTVIQKVLDEPSPQSSMSLDHEESIPF